MTNNNYKSFGDLYSNLTMSKKVKVVSVWQDEASNAVKFFSDSERFVGSIFKAFRDHNQLAKFALSDCKELNKHNSLYFLKVLSELVKKQANK